MILDTSKVLGTTKVGKWPWPTCNGMVDRWLTIIDSVVLELKMDWCVTKRNCIKGRKMEKDKRVCWLDSVP